jgi:hypothetical protein
VFPVLISVRFRSPQLLNYGYSKRRLPCDGHAFDGKFNVFRRRGQAVYEEANSHKRRGLLEDNSPKLLSPHRSSFPELHLGALLSRKLSPQVLLSRELSSLKSFSTRSFSLLPAFHYQSSSLDVCLLCHKMILRRGVDCTASGCTSI